MPRPGILDIDTYVPGKSSAPGVARRVQAVVQRDAARAEPQGGGRLCAGGGEARRSIRKARRACCARRSAEAHGLDPARIVCGAGSDELLNLLAHAYVGPGDEAIITEHGFLVYKIAILGRGGTPVVVPETGYTADVDAILANVTEHTKIVFIANPNNPTGTYLPAEEVARLHAGLRPDILLVLDAAYSEYVRRNDYADGLELVDEAENVVMTHTFSKIFGLADLADRLDLRAGTRGRRAEPHPRAVQCQRRGGDGGRGGAARIARIWKRPSPTTSNGSTGCISRLSGARPARHAERGQFRARPLPGRRRAGRRRMPTRS